MSASRPFLRRALKGATVMGRKSPTSKQPRGSMCTKHPLSSEKDTGQGGAKPALVLPTLERNEEENEPGKVSPFPQVTPPSSKLLLVPMCVRSPPRACPHSHNCEWAVRKVLGATWLLPQRLWHPSDVPSSPDQPRLGGMWLGSFPTHWPPLCSAKITDRAGMFAGWWPYLRSTLAAPARSLQGQD